MSPAPSTVRWLDVEPPLEPHEVRFLGGFCSSAEEVHRVWPGQPGAVCPWVPSADGTRLELDEGLACQAPELISAWLRFLIKAFLSPARVEDYDLALDQGLGGGHRVYGELHVGTRRVAAYGHRVEEQILKADVDAQVLEFIARPEPTGPRRKLARRKQQPGTPPSRGR